MKRLLILVGLVGLIGAMLLSLPATALGATHPWGGNGWPVSVNCTDADPGETLWIWTGGTPTALTVNGVAQSGSWVQSGNGSWKFVTGWFTNEPNHDTTFVTYTGDDGVLTITHGCPPESPPPTPVVTPAPTPVVTPAPTPVVTPAPTPVVTPAPTPVVTPAPTPVVTPPTAAQFSVVPAACRFEGDDTRLRFRILAGILLFSQIDIYIDGEFIDRNDIDIVDGPSGPEAFIVVAPGLRAWTITEEGNPEAVLAEGETVCPTCFNLAAPTPTPGVPGAPGTTAPPTDTIGAAIGTATSSPLPLLLIVFAIASAVLLMPSGWFKRRR